MGRCAQCGAKGSTISDAIGLCANCIKNLDADSLRDLVQRVHRVSRERYGLPLKPPDEGEARCSICVNECRVPNGAIGFCGYWRCNRGSLEPLFGSSNLFVEYYLDPLPTNCVATPVCPAATGCGYPRYAAKPGTEDGFYNLAVFLSACNLDCLFCQNHIYKRALSLKLREYIKPIEEIVSAAEDPRITCVCYFGGDPTPFAPQLIRASRAILDRSKGRVKRICWETNGLANPELMRRMAEISLESGGIVKIDWKCCDPKIYSVLTGVDGFRAIERIKRNIRLVAEMARRRPEVPLLVVSTLLVPGYVDCEEVENIARFIASIDPSIPYILLAFHPDHLLRDLPPTSLSHANEALKRAREAGLERVYLENAWLLGNYY
ncbi:MAG: radical SAM protein [Crenarchaeota archaeon]|nr:radical SAM protein [Thermoproteota archaeon]